MNGSLSLQKTLANQVHARMGPDASRRVRTYIVSASKDLREHIANTKKSRILADLTHVKMVANVFHLAMEFIVIASLSLKENIVKRTRILAALAHVKTEGNVIHLAKAFIVIANLILVENSVKKHLPLPQHLCQASQLPLLCLALQQHLQLLQNMI